MIHSDYFLVLDLPDRMCLEIGSSGPQTSKGLMFQMGAAERASYEQLEAPYFNWYSKATQKNQCSKNLRIGPINPASALSDG